ncbi:MAG: hypothetical protein IJ019_04235 [Alphaproteobacteria bacterium]|nr:hypothetical protein [Alphaproteobacteria bacterium]
MTVIAVLFAIAYIRNKREENAEKNANAFEDVSDTKFKGMDSEQVLTLKVEDMCAMSHDDLKKLVDYAGHRMVETTGDERRRWGKLFDDASAALYGYL